MNGTNFQASLGGQICRETLLIIVRRVVIPLGKTTGKKKNDSKKQDNNVLHDAHDSPENDADNTAPAPNKDQRRRLQHLQQLQARLSVTQEVRKRIPKIQEGQIGTVSERKYGSKHQQQNHQHPLQFQFERTPFAQGPQPSLIPTPPGSVANPRGTPTMGTRKFDAYTKSQLWRIKERHGKKPRTMIGSMVATTITHQPCNQGRILDVPIEYCGEQQHQQQRLQHIPTIVTATTNQSPLVVRGNGDAENLGDGSVISSISSQSNLDIGIEKLKQNDRNMLQDMVWEEMCLRVEREHLLNNQLNMKDPMLRTWTIEQMALFFNGMMSEQRKKVMTRRWSLQGHLTWIFKSKHNTDEFLCCLLSGKTSPGTQGTHIDSIRRAWLEPIFERIRVLGAQAFVVGPEAQGA
mmetsp:Transcript_34989/g.73424  ORF Transcript_34989/g.73424 Transcript_34989/m.73424 type:complete len:406 (-) Transcript_34989:171-1388(-)